MREVSRVRLMAGGIGLAAAVAYLNSFSVPFHFDDIPSIVDNPTIRQLWPLSGPLSPPGEWGQTVGGRPLVNLSLALNHAVSGQAVWSYHGLNLLVHIGAAWALFGLLRATLGRPKLAALLGGRVEVAAGLAALLWALHPLQTQAVTYVVQRAESLMGLCYFLTLYFFSRSVATMEQGRGGRRWLVGAWLACAAGMGCKEVMVSAPVVVLLYDRTFWAGTFGEAWRRRRGFYLALAATWLPLAALVWANRSRGDTFVFTPAAALSYWLTQPEALFIYLRLTFWPLGQALDYGRSALAGWEQILLGGGVLGLAAASVWAWRLRPALGFCGVAFFVVLAPTSVMPGALQTIVEHRMYVPLAAVLAPVVVGVMALGGRRGALALLGVAVLAGAATARRNEVYRDAWTLWSDTVANRPESAIGQANLASEWLKQGRWEDARQGYERAIAADGKMPAFHYSLGVAWQQLGEPERALGAFREAVRLQPLHAPAEVEIGRLLLAQGRAGEAIAPLEHAVTLLTEPAEAWQLLGLCQMALGQPDLAVGSFQGALEARPEFIEARLNQGIALAQAGRLAEARAQLTAVVERRPDLTEAQENLGHVCLELGELAAAVTCYAEALRGDTANVEVRYRRGVALARLQRWPEAKREFSEVVRRAPDHAEARRAVELLQAVPE